MEKTSEKIDQDKQREKINKLIDAALDALKQKAKLAIEKLTRDYMTVKSATENAPVERVTSLSGSRLGARTSAVMAARAMSSAAMRLRKGKRLEDISESGTAILRLFELQKNPSARPISNIFQKESEPIDTAQLIHAVRSAIKGVVYALDEHPSAVLEGLRKIPEKDFYEAIIKSDFGAWKFPPKEVTDLVAYISGLSKTVSLKNPRERIGARDGRDVQIELAMTEILKLLESEETMINDPRTRSKIAGGMVALKMRTALHELLAGGKIARIYYSLQGKKCYYVLKERADQMLSTGEIGQTGLKSPGYNFVLR